MEAKKEKILQLIKNKPQENHFFKKLATAKKPHEWLIPLKEKGYFDPGKNPKPQEITGKKEFYTIPRWNILGYLENVAEKNENIQKDEITINLIEIIDSLINFRDRNKRIENTWTDHSIVKIIFSLPLEKITNKHIEFFETYLKSQWDNTLIEADIGGLILPKLLKQRADKLILKLLNIIFDYKRNVKISSDEFTSIIDEYWLSEALRINKPEIAKLCGIEAADIAIEKIKSIVNEDKEQFNVVWIPTIEDNPQINFPHKYECQMVQFVRDMYELYNPEKIKQKVKSLIKEEHPIFRRIGVHIINIHYYKLNCLFWEWKGNPLDDTLLTHELFELFKVNCCSFSDNQIKTIVKWIETEDYNIIEDNEDLLKILAYKKKEWLISLLGTKNNQVINSFKKYNQINNTVPKHPGFLIWYESSWGGKSPITCPELLKKSNEEITYYINNFKEDVFLDLESPSIDGLKITLKSCVVENPKKFTSNLKPFENVNRKFQYSLLRGLLEAWNEKKTFNWDNLFQFIIEIINSEEFWTEKYKEKEDHYGNEIISLIAELINDGTKDDNHAFDSKLLPQAEIILLKLLENSKSNYFEIIDSFTSTLNSILGKIYSAMINYSLRCARLSGDKKNERWIPSIKDIFDKRLDRNIEPSREFFSILGRYISNLYYLDKNWVNKNINLIFPKKNNIYWEAAFEGYLYIHTVHEYLYKLLRKNNHYNKALRTNFKNEHIKEYIVQHICIAYINSTENIEDENSLINKLIKNKKTFELSALITYMWNQGDEINVEHKKMIKPLWEKLYEVFSQNENKPEYQNLISDISKWLVLVDKIDEQIFKWLKLSAKYLNIRYNTPFFIEYLLSHSYKTPDKVGEIYIEMLNANIYPDYKKENIQKIVKNLYKKDQKTNADIICNLYGTKGFDFLRDICIEYNKN